MPENPTNDWIHFASWLVAFTGGVIAAVVALYNVIENRNQRKKELRWRKASAAKTILDELFTNAQAWNAALMMDSTDEGREYEITANQVVRISWGDVLCALKKEDASRAAVKHRLIRDSFDYFFYFVDRIEHYIAIDLVTYEDVEAPLRRYARKIANQNATFEHFMIAQNYHLALNFFRRFDDST